MNGFSISSLCKPNQNSKSWRRKGKLWQRSNETDRQIQVDWFILAETSGRLFPHGHLLLDSARWWSVCEMSRKLRWHLFLDSIVQGMRSFVSICQRGCLALLYYFCLTDQPHTKHLAVKQEGRNIGSARIRSFVALLTKHSRLYCMHTHHSKVFFRTMGWMQMGCDSSRALIFGATHEWRCSTTDRKSCCLSPTVPPPSPYSRHSLSLESLSTISKSVRLHPSFPVLFSFIQFGKMDLEEILFDLFQTPEKHTESQVPYKRNQYPFYSVLEREQ